MEEIWKDISGYEGLYQVSNYGNVRSLNRLINKSGNIHRMKGRVLKNRLGTTGYYGVSLSKKGIVKPFQVHQLVAMAFLGHKRNGYNKVVDHINHIRTDNRVINLRILDVRDNTSYSKRNKKGTLIGAHFSKNENKWKSSIRCGEKSFHIGYFENEHSASEAYLHIKKLINDNIDKEEILNVIISNYRKSN